MWKRTKVYFASKMGNGRIGVHLAKDHGWRFAADGSFLVSKPTVDDTYVLIQIEFGGTEINLIFNGNYD